MNENRKQFFLVSALIVLGAAARLLPHPANFTPVAAIALLGGAFLEGSLAFLLPLGILVLSDFFLGFHSTAAFVYTGFIIAAAMGRTLKEAGAGKVAFTALAGTLAFFVISNFGVWLVGGLYPRSGQGLVDCYAAALPFLRNSAVGDLIYASALFAIVRRLGVPQPQTVTAAA